MVVSTGVVILLVLLGLVAMVGTLVVVCPLVWAARDRRKHNRHVQGNYGDRGNCSLCATLNNRALPASVVQSGTSSSSSSPSSPDLIQTVQLPHVLPETATATALPKAEL